MPQVARQERRVLVEGTVGMAHITVGAGETLPLLRLRHRDDLVLVRPVTTDGRVAQLVRARP
jgi:hypothetical protein